MLYLTTCHMAGIKSGSKMSFDHLNELPINTSPDAKNEVEEHQDIDIHDLFGSETPEDDHNVEEKHENLANSRPPKSLMITS